MKLLVGLGNIGDKYKLTRHNFGFEAIDYLAEIYKMSFNNFQNIASLAKGKILSEEVILCKPSLFMNSSGIPVKKVKDYYKIFLEDVFIIYDDYSLPFGKLRFRRKGSSGGHNGIKSIIENFSNENFYRLKLGINNDSKSSLTDFVLGKFTEEEIEKMPLVFEVLNKIVSIWIKYPNDKKLEILNNYQIN